MRKLRIVCLGIAAAALAACGTETKSSSETPATENVTVAATATPATTRLPEVVVTRVALDTEGNEVHSNVTAAAVFNSQNITDANAAAQAFAGGEAINLQKDELDTDSSTESWYGNRAGWYWNTPWYPGKLLGRGLWWGHNPYRFYSNNSYWNYGYSHNYSCNNYRYYVYNQY